MCSHIGGGANDCGGGDVHVGEACWEGSMVSVLILETGVLFPWWPVSNGKVWSQRKVASFLRELKCLDIKHKTWPNVPKSHRKVFNVAV